MKLRLLSYIFAALLAVGPAQAQSQLLLGAGKPGTATPPSACSSFMPAAFNSSALYINWTTADGIGGFGMACLNGTTAVAASTLGATSGTASTGASGLTLTSGFFNFTDLTWLTASTGTFYIHTTLTAFNAATVTLIEGSDGTGNNTEAIRAQNSNKDVNGLGIVGGVSQNNFITGTFVLTGLNFKTAYSYTAGAQILCAGSTASATASGASTPGAYSQFRIGASPTGAGTWAGVVTETAFFSTALADAAACNALTT